MAGQRDHATARPVAFHDVRRVEQVRLWLRHACRLTGPFATLARSSHRPQGSSSPARILCLILASASGSSMESVGAEFVAELAFGDLAGGGAGTSSTRRTDSGSLK